MGILNKLIIGVACLGTCCATNASHLSSEELTILELRDQSISETVDLKGQISTYIKFCEERSEYFGELLEEFQKEDYDQIDGSIKISFLAMKNCYFLVAEELKVILLQSESQKS